MNKNYIYVCSACGWTAQAYEPTEKLIEHMESHPEPVNIEREFH